MLASIVNIFSKVRTRAPYSYFDEEQNTTVHLFSLKYKRFEMGTLKFKDNEWVFAYSQWFKNQNELQPLLEFPDKEKVYTTKELWPFFTDRIPSFKQPKIKNYIEQHPTERTNLAKLLEVFGEYSVNNPFRLETK